MIQKYWNCFMEETGRKNAALKGSICFGDSLALAEKNAAAILDGKKTLMTYPENGYRTALKGMPSVGDLNIIVNWAGKPICVIETDRVNTFRFADFSEEILSAELPDDEKRVEAKETEFKREIEELGFQFDENISVVCESFRVIWPEQA